MQVQVVSVAATLVLAKATLNSVQVSQTTKEAIRVLTDHSIMIFRHFQKTQTSWNDGGVPVLAADLFIRKAMKSFLSTSRCNTLCSLG
jgi:hypothetical protein